MTTTIEIIKQAREHLGMSQRELARSLCRDFASISRLEAGNASNFSGASLADLTRILELDADELCEAFGKVSPDAVPATAQEMRACRRAIAKTRAALSG